ncbi:hypothetical protein IGI04_041151 [Brassica rapa subsp. trilocularis]|uniref:Pectinesterase n=1 Tax=Brassica rapa subsp. trilocularis TaxID=1813537 RepID=A0ABQ7KST6_BRACM|nr:hypothetical protein IGI04_041151 [Brassica rapa subsp. trilocularis]
MPQFSSSQAPILILPVLIILLCSTQTQCHTKGLRLRPRNQKIVNSTSQTQNPEEEFLKWVRYVGSLKHTVFKAAKNKLFASYTLTVHKKHNKGDFTKIQDAIDSLPLINLVRVVIKVHAGVYKEKVNIPPMKAFITIEGEGADKTIVQWGDTAQTHDPKGNPMGTFNSASFAVNSPFFVAKNITFKNTTPVPLPGAVGKQAVALRVSADNAAFFGCKMLGAQDTLYDHLGRHYYKDCYIEGSVDFIFGNALSLYEGCHVHAIADKLGAVTAQGRSSVLEDTGFSFVKCKVTGTGVLYLGRAWGPFSRVVFAYTYMDNIILPKGWYNWGDPSREMTVFYGQYKCTGAGANYAGRVAWARELTDEEAKPFISLTFIDALVFLIAAFSFPETSLLPHTLPLLSLLRQRFHRLKPPHPHAPPPRRRLISQRRSCITRPLLLHLLLPQIPPRSLQKSSKSIIAFSLEQEHLGDNPYADEVTPTFHAYAKSGDVSGPAAYANYGRVEDFLGLNVSGAVVVARYGEIYRGDIVRNAYEAGAVGVVIYTDERDYGGGDECFPESKWMPPSGVQVGTVYKGLGDPTTPGWASVDGCERVSEEGVELRGDSPGIPSLPISAADAEVILKSVVGGVGPGPGILNLSYVGKTVIAEIENVIGVIEGEEEPDRYVILGNHRDAWTFGAVDPNSGTAVLLEIAQRLDKLQKRGWKPRRTIILCNWDAEEYALIGSTEWVEDNREMLASRAVAYLNADCAVSGPGFRASATPQLDDLIKQVAKEVRDLDNTTQSIYESWIRSNNSGVIGRLGSGASDYASFVQHVGVPAVDMLFGGGYPVYHSMYDDFTWMEKFGDPMFQRHVAIASVLGLVALRLAGDEFLPFNYSSYASELKKSAEDLEKEKLGHSIDISPLIKSIQDLSTAAQEINIEKERVKTKASWEHVQHEIWRVSRAIRHASLVLKGELR